MLKQRLTIARNVVVHLHEAERTNDQALIATARLAVAMLEGRLALDTAAEVGHDAFEAVATTFASQTNGRRGLVQAHSVLLDVKRIVGLEDYYIGGAGNKQVPSGGLTVVQNAA